MNKKIALLIYLIMCFSLLIIAIINKTKTLCIVAIVLLTIAAIYVIYKLVRRYRGKVYIDYNKRDKEPNDIKKVSAVIPNYNYANYIENRIDSILNQTYPIYELIILDDCSTDNSDQVIKNKIKEINNKNIIVKYIKNEKNSGNVFKQWKKAFEESTGDYLWIAEADDLCDEHFLNVAMQGFADEDVVMSYTESKKIDENGMVTSKDFRYWSDIFNIKLWNKDFTIDGKEFLDKSLCINNSIVNASAVIFKKIDQTIINDIINESIKYKLSGDWYFYSKFLLNGKISYSTDSLNKHRMHESSVTNSTNIEMKNEEMVRIQDSIGNDIKLSTNAKNSIRKINLYSKKTERKGISNYLPNLIKKIIKLVNRVIILFVKGLKWAWKKHHFLVPFKEWKRITKKIKTIVLFGNENHLIDIDNETEYKRWLNIYEEKTKKEIFKYNPLISFVIPVYNVSSKLLSECIDSILKQEYQNFEICIADDCSTNSETIETLKYYEKRDKRIKIVYRDVNGHISQASNSALRISSGEFIAMMDNDDVIPKNALSEVVKALNKNPKIDFIYTDEDKINSKGERCYPHFKPDYSPDSLLSVNYFCHFTVLRKKIVDEIGGWRKGYEGAQDWDLFLRFVEKTENIYHIPKILYHWRMSESSTSSTTDNKEYINDSSIKALEDTIKRRKLNAVVHKHEKVPYYWFEYKFDKEPMISIIIPTRDYSDILKKCLDSIYKNTKYKNYEIIVVNNNSEEQETYNLFDEYKNKHKNFRVLDANFEFNYSKINNLAVKDAKGEYIVLLNNDTEVITPNWLTYMVGYASQEHIGAVGAKLVYSDKTIQHGGVIIGLEGIAGHAFINEPLSSVGKTGRLCIPFNYSAVTAACLMVKKDKYNKVNGLNEDLKVAYNDVDFCLKLYEDKYYNIICPQVELFHYESKTRGKDDNPAKKERAIKEQKYMYKKWKKYIINDPMYNVNLSRRKSFFLDSQPYDYTYLENDNE